MSSAFFQPSIITSLGKNAGMISASGRTTSDIQISKVENLAKTETVSFNGLNGVSNKSGIEADNAVDLKGEVDVSNLAGQQLSFEYGNKTFTITFDSDREYNSLDDVADEINKQLGNASISLSDGTSIKMNSKIKAEVSGSDKRFCFCLPPKRESKKLAIYEAAIEPLAHLTLEGTTDKWRLSLGGIYAPEEGKQTSRDMKNPIALDAFLARHPEIEEIEICTNNDFAGRWAADHIEKAYQGKYRMVRNLPKKEGCDYADLTKEKYEKQAVRQRAACSR